MLAKYQLNMDKYRQSVWHAGVQRERVCKMQGALKAALFLAHNALSPLSLGATHTGVQHERVRGL